MERLIGRKNGIEIWEIDELVGGPDDGDCGEQETCCQEPGRYGKRRLQMEAAGASAQEIADEISRMQKESLDNAWKLLGKRGKIKKALRRKKKRFGR